MLVYFIKGEGHREMVRMMCDKKKKTSYINDLEALLEKLVGLVWEVVFNPVLGGFIGLIDVNSFSWAIYLSKSSVASVYS